MDNRAEQYEYEEDSDVAAAAKKLQELRVDSLEGSLELPRATKLVAHMFGDVQDYLQAECEIKTRGLGGQVKNWLRALPLDIAAVIAIRECIAMLSGANSVSIQTLATQIGRMWETEIRVREAEQVNPMYMQKIAKQLKERNTVNKEHIRKVYDVAYKRVMKDVFDSSLGPTELIQLGKYGVQACMSAGMVYNTSNTTNLSTVVQYWLTPEVLEFLTDYTQSDVRAVMDKAQSAMLCHPDPWTNISEGGYLTPRRKLHSPLLNLTHVRMSERPRLRELFTAENMPMVFQAGNYLQSVAYTLHKPTLDALTRVWQSGGGILGVPTKNPPTKPECPFPPDWIKDDSPKEEQEQFAVWKRKAVLWYEQVKSWKGHVRELGGHMRISHSHMGRPIWFPMYLDTRGRWYYRGVPNPQGSDLAKSVLHLHHKKPLGSRGLFWLKVAIANHYGFDKDRFIDRAAWTDKHWEDIERALDEPENHPDVWGSDSPWCMYSAAWELREAYRSGDPTNYCTGVIVHMDATCSGLQHFSALLRDPVGGQCVNLTDDLKCGPKQDIYSKVSTMAMQSMMQDLESTDPEVAAMAKWWMPIGIPRSMAKKPVMTYVYGATLRGTTGFVRDYAENELKLKWPDELLSYKYAQYIAQKLFEGIARTVPAAEYAMLWLRNVAKVQPRGKRMEWTTPTGFVVQHDYQQFHEKKVFLRSCGVTSVMVRQALEDTNPLQMQNAIAPNFVHSLDASHLTLTALKMHEEGLSMVGIHDSFGTHPCDVDAMHKHIRVAFVELYQGRNILGEFLWDVQSIGDPPMRGTLDVSEVLDSEFFFC